MKNIAVILVAVTTLTGCEWAREKIHTWTAPPPPSVVTQSGTIASQPKDPSVPFVVPPVITPREEPDVACANDPKLVLCRAYKNKEALLADPKVKAFGFAVLIDNNVVKPGMMPGINYRTLPNGNLSRG